ncbi:Adenylyl cyclase class-3/4/guanylyl cyclase domain protein [Candidatus Magnetobacterium bavaricum]|uniref:Adenylyl cyclase class-3/4/guanylyl cyclase domain protein n=1 Tax=Candidatus Magnetobacterium bavaricum TaxID=29290 RepID=A0A0F3GIN1_9BACT|nr:Adenylyl cyclase class-3/4/guanylyl cyclase domain protein [Candidatus Magnetobacterium bavaricum]
MESVRCREDRYMGCGIHTGEATVGLFGPEFHNQFTALGPHVNLASIIESEDKSGQILVSSTTWLRVKSDISLSYVKDISDVKNIPGTFSFYSVNE